MFRSLSALKNFQGVLPGSMIQSLSAPKSLQGLQPGHWLQRQKLRGSTAKGFAAPGNFSQELHQFQILSSVRSNLENIAMAFNDTVDMTQEVMADLGAIFGARVPVR